MNSERTCYIMTTVGYNGITFKNNDKEFFLKKFEIFKKLDRKKIKIYYQRLEV